MDTQATQSQISDLYKTILQQDNAHTTEFIYVLLGIVALLLGVTWWWNKMGANRYIRDKVKEEVAKEIIIITEQIRAEADSKIEEKLKNFDTTVSDFEKQISQLEKMDYYGMIDKKINPVTREFNTKISDMNTFRNGQFQDLINKIKECNETIVSKERGLVELIGERGNDIRKDIINLTNELDEEFYFIRLKLRYQPNLEWNPKSESGNMSFNNLYDERQRLLLKTHQWIFGNTTPNIK